MHLLLVSCITSPLVTPYNQPRPLRSLRSLLHRLYIPFLATYLFSHVIYSTSLRRARRRKQYQQPFQDLLQKYHVNLNNSPCLSRTPLPWWQPLLQSLKLTVDTSTFMSAVKLLQPTASQLLMLPPAMRPLRDLSSQPSAPSTQTPQHLLNLSHPHLRHRA